MKRIFQTLILAAFVVLTTASFGYAEYVATSAGKHKYSRLYLSEAVGSFALYAVLVALFTAPVVNALKTLVS